MSNPVSAPLAPAQPNAAVYGIQALALFQTYTRASYLAAFGVQAPPFDPSRLVKTWCDSTADTSNPGNVSVYKIAGQDASGKWGLQQMVIPAIEAATVNLPGLVTYPSYVVAPTQATRGGAVLNSLYLSLQSDAQALMSALGGSNLVDEGAAPVFPVTYPPGEARRLWDFTVNGRIYSAGALIGDRNAHGVGAPGHWDTSGAFVTWVPDAPPPDGLNDTRPPREMPLRDLLPNEQFQVGLMGVGVMRTDLAAAQPTSGEFLPDDRATLQRIYQIVSRLGL